MQSMFTPRSIPTPEITSSSYAYSFSSAFHAYE
jgi:hypothetical protein